MHYEFNGKKVNLIERTFIECVGFILDKYGTWFIQGAVVTIFIAILGTLIGVLIGIVISVFFSLAQTNEIRGFRRWLYKPVKLLLKIYVKVFRGTPMLIQAVIMYYGLMEALQIDLNHIVVGVLVIALNTGAYMTETARAGIDSVQNGQGQAADALGLKHKDKMFKIFMPQAIVNILPNVGNELVSNIKDTSILNVISVGELFFVTKSIKGMIFRTYEPFLIASCIYLLLTALVNLLLNILEKMFQRNLKTVKLSRLSQSCQYTEVVSYEVKTTFEAKHILEIRHVNKSYGTNLILNDINLNVDLGKVYTIIGSSGIGKTTLLKCIAQLEKIDSGEILFMGEPIDCTNDFLRPRIGIIFQNFRLFKNLTVLENCTIGPTCVKGKTIKEAETIAKFYLSKLSMLEYSDYKPEALSNGQAQRVAIARALSMQPQLLLFDEPTSALDPELRSDITRLISDLVALNVSIINVTHDIEFAKYASDIIIHIVDGEIEEADTPNVIFNVPKSEKTKAFLNRVDLSK